MALPFLQMNDEFTPGAWFAGDSDVTSMQLDDFLGQGQPDPCASVLASNRAISLAESLEYSVELVMGNTNSGVMDTDVNLRFRCVHPESDIAARSRELQGI